MAAVRTAKNGSHPFTRKEPKPTRARLVSLLDPLGRKRYGEVERFLATINGATSGLHYYDTNWGWAVRYMLGAKDALCTLHLLPNSFEATVPVDEGVKANGTVLAPELRRRIGRTRTVNGKRLVRVPLRSDADYQNFQGLVTLKAETLKTKPKKAAAKGKPAEKAKPRAKATSKK
ncbi:MAG: DUF3788 domain-containing protein [Planctomycetota bacterium]|nr:DUF3788 domain-containing protein [Planctomycetota bacterium]